MPLALSIAIRYLFGKKSTNAINIITGISVLGIAIGTAALILIMSVLNGFEGLMKGYLDTFNPDFKIVPIQGKFFYADEPWVTDLSLISGVEAYSKVIEEVVWLEYRDNQHVGIIKGVDDQYTTVNKLSESITDGEVDFTNSEFGTNAIIGKGVSNVLNVSLNNPYTPVMAHVPKRNKKIFDKDFKSRPLLASGVFSIANERDNQYVISSYDMVSSLLDLYDQVSAIEIKMKPDVDPDDVIAAIRTAAGDKYKVLDRYQQDESFLRIMKVEKWSAYFILGFVLLLITFNVIGSLWMIVLDKKKDISVLQSFGGTKNLIRKIFLWEGFLISCIGFLVGFLVALVFYILQKTVGVISVPEGFAVSSYPIQMDVFDVVVVFITVLILGNLASIPATKRAIRISAQVRHE